MDLSNLWPWSFTFYICVESLFDRLVERGQIESFRIKSNPKVFGYRCNFPVWKSPIPPWSKAAQAEQWEQELPNYSLYSVGFQLTLWVCAGTDSSVLAFPLGILGLLVQLPLFLAEQEEVGSIPQLTPCLAAEQEGTFVPSFLSGVNFYCGSDCSCHFLTLEGSQGQCPVCTAVIFSCSLFIQTHLQRDSNLSKRQELSWGCLSPP